MGIMQTIVIQTFGNRENIVKILAVKHIRQSGSNPFVALGALAFGAVPVPATIIRNMDFPAFIAPFNVTAKRCRPAIFKCIQYAFVIRQNIVMLIEPFVVSPNNICDFVLRLHAKNCKEYPADFSLIWARLEQYEDR